MQMGKDLIQELMQGKKEPCTSENHPKQKHACTICRANRDTPLKYMQIQYCMHFIDIEWCKHAKLKKVQISKDVP